MLDLRHEHTSTWQGRPPRMSAHDYAIWQRYHPEKTRGALRIWYDVGLGNGKEPDPNLDAKLQKMWRRNTQKRADAIVEYTQHYELVEIRQNADNDVIGRILLYIDLWNKEKPQPKPTTMTILTDIETEDLSNFAKRFNIDYIIV